MGHSDGEFPSSGLLLLEHLNLNVPDWDVAERFYRALGCQRAKVKIHMNCGPHTQFHLPIEAPTQPWRGCITIAYTAEGLAAARVRLTTLVGSESDTGVTVAPLEEEGGALAVRGPWGTSFCLREGTPEERAMAALPTKRPATNETLAMGVLGIVEVALPVARGRVESLARFYDEVMRFKVDVAPGKATIVGGPVVGSQRLSFREVDEVDPYTGDHFAIYVGDFEGCFSRCQERGLLYVNPRFTFLDNTQSIEDARHYQAFRVLRIRDDEDNDVLEEEHEIRSSRHKLIPLVARDRTEPDARL